MKIAISGKSGCGNTSVSKLVADRLGIVWINYTFRMMAADKGLDFVELRRRAEHDDSYDRELDAHQVELAKGVDCVLGSRLAIWLLPEADLRVYLEASPEVRAERIVAREGGDYQKKLQETLERDRQDAARYQRIYGIDTDDYTFADVVIQTENHTPSVIADMIIAHLNS
ncbi:MAG: (d)CMP kinase [Spirochaetota bacterium]